MGTCMNSRGLPYSGMLENPLTDTPFFRLSLLSMRTSLFKIFSARTLRLT
jgi:hypothetical protein